jgi:hypothetical protein
MKQISRMVLGVTLLWVAISSRAQASDGPPTDLTAQVDKHLREMEPHGFIRMRAVSDVTSMATE